MVSAILCNYSGCIHSSLLCVCCGAGTRGDMLPLLIQPNILTACISIINLSLCDMQIKHYTMCISTATSKACLFIMQAYMQNWRHCISERLCMKFCPHHCASVNWSRPHYSSIVAYTGVANCQWKQISYRLFLSICVINTNTTLPAVHALTVQSINQPN